MTDDTKKSSGEVIVYALKLTDGCFYVGATTRPTIDQRLVEHLMKQGASWTVLHPVVHVCEVFTCADPGLEHTLTLRYMAKYGIDKVRGGIYVNPTLSKRAIVDITAMISSSGGTGLSPVRQKKYTNLLTRMETNTCFLCGKPGHFVAECPIRPPVAYRRVGPGKYRCMRCGYLGCRYSRCVRVRDVFNRIIKTPPKTPPPQPIKWTL